MKDPRIRQNNEEILTGQGVMRTAIAPTDNPKLTQNSNPLSKEFGAALLVSFFLCLPIPKTLPSLWGDDSHSQTRNESTEIGSLAEVC